MKDKQGKEIDVGDVVEFYDSDTAGGLKPTKGKVTLALPGAIRAVWEDTNREQSCSSSECLTLITKAGSILAEPQNSDFTQEDEAMLQSLIARKAKHEDEVAKITTAKRNLQEMVDKLSCNHWNMSNKMMDYFKVKANADTTIQILKAYHGIN